MTHRSSLLAPLFASMLLLSGCGSSRESAAATDVPAGCGPMTVVLVLSGSGSTDRDGNAPGAPGKPTIYKVLGKAINDAGYATLRYDEPGIGKSATAVSKGVVNQEATPRRVAHVGILEFSGEPP